MPPSEDTMGDPAGTPFPLAQAAPPIPPRAEHDWNDDDLMATSDPLATAPPLSALVQPMNVLAATSTCPDPNTQPPASCARSMGGGLIAGRQSNRVPRAAARARCMTQEEMRTQAHRLRPAVDHGGVVQADGARGGNRAAGPHRRAVREHARDHRGVARARACPAAEDAAAAAGCERVLHIRPSGDEGRRGRPRRTPVAAGRDASEGGRGEDERRCVQGATLRAAATGEHTGSAFPTAD